MSDLWNEAVRILDAGGRFILAAVTAKSGSSPASLGAVMLVDEQGGTMGAIGGGMLEAEAALTARRMMANGGNETLRFNLDNAEAAAGGMVCGGTAEVFLHAAVPGEAEAFSAARDCLAAGERGFLLFRRDASLGLPLFSPTADAGAEGWEDAVRVPLFVAGNLFIFGCGHVGVETARLARMVDFNVTALDDRDEFANAARFPGSTAVLLESFDPLPAFGFDVDSYVVIATRGHQHDLAVLDQVLKTGAGYIGMIGSRRKREMVRARLVELGHAGGGFDRVHSPIGLDIGSETPAEIAVSIVAELVRERASRRKGE